MTNYHGCGAEQEHPGGGGCRERSPALQRAVAACRLHHLQRELPPGLYREVSIFRSEQSARDMPRTMTILLLRSFQQTRLFGRVICCHPSCGVYNVFVRGCGINMGMICRGYRSVPHASYRDTRLRCCICTLRFIPWCTYIN